MKVLFLTAFYPPHVIGGWEQLVEEINAGLIARSHPTHVLTSDYGAGESSNEPGVDRVLKLEADLINYRPSSLSNYRTRLRANLAATRRAIESFKPDVVFVHIMWNLTRGIPWMAEKLCPGRVVYYVADHWPCSADPHTQYWKDDAQRPFRNLAKRLASPAALAWIRVCNRRFQLEFRKVLCVSQWIRDELLQEAQLAPARLQVVHNGIDTRRFHRARTGAVRANGNFSLLFAGSLVWHKGAHTAVEALGWLRKQGRIGGIELAILGSGHPRYEEELHQLVLREGVQENVCFLPRIERDAMPDLMSRFDALVFPSLWEEPLARVTQEAMASGMVVIGTATGGTREILIDEGTGLVFPPGDAAALARQILRASADHELRQRLSKAAQSLVSRQFEIGRMIDQIEEHLKMVTRN